MANFLARPIQYQRIAHEIPRETAAAIFFLEMDKFGPSVALEAGNINYQRNNVRPLVVTNGVAKSLLGLWLATDVGNRISG